MELVSWELVSCQCDPFGHCRRAVAVEDLDVDHRADDRGQPGRERRRTGSPCPMPARGGRLRDRSALASPAEPAISSAAGERASDSASITRSSSPAMSLAFPQETLTAN